MRLLIVTASVMLFSLQLFAADEVVKTISKGEAVDEAAQLIPGKFTVLEFYADW